MASQDFAHLIGKIAVTDTELSPKGTAMFAVNSGEEEIHEVQAEEGYIEASRGVKVTRVRGRKIFVRRV
jgi:membrane-bound ClpP family serine protease